MKLKSIVGYVPNYEGESPKIHVIINHIVWYRQSDKENTLIKTTAGDMYIIHITLGEFKKIIEQ